jgi:UDP-3-O-[3-hydroxymyristoyl] glucosamine N-acyltransferase
MSTSDKSISLAEISNYLNIPLSVDAGKYAADKDIIGIASLESAGEMHISFLSNPKKLAELQFSKAAGVIVKPEFADKVSSIALVCDNPYLAYAQLSQLFDDAPVMSVGIDPTAVVAATATIQEGVFIGPHVVIGEYAVVGADSRIAANSCIGDYSVIGQHCHIHSGVHIYHRVRMGDYVSIHSGTIIGCDGFGYAPSGIAGNGWKKICQLGGVLIGNHVEIGAGTCIDRGALDDTEIHDGVIIDNHVHIAHNCIIGDSTALAGGVAMAGATIIGKNCTVAGMAGLAGQIEIADNVHITGKAMVTNSIKEAGAYSSGTGLQPSREWRKSVIRFRQLDDMAKRLNKLEKNQRHSVQYQSEVI